MDEVCMNILRVAAIGAGMAIAAVTVGCQQVVSIDNPIRVADHEYDRVFDQTVEVLRGHQFVVERQDRRFGVISTRPQIASSLLEPWRGDNTTAEQVAQNTLNLRRRSVRVLLEPAIDPNGMIDGPGYQLYVEVRLEQRQHPPRMLNTATASSVASYGADAGARSVETAAGAERSFWRPIGRDERLEQRLVAEIIEPSARPADEQANPDDRAQPTDDETDRS